MPYAKFYFHEAEFQFISPTGKYEKKHDLTNVERYYRNSSTDDLFGKKCRRLSHTEPLPLPGLGCCALGWPTGTVRGGRPLEGELWWASPGGHGPFRKDTWCHSRRSVIPQAISFQTNVERWQTISKAAVHSCVSTAGQDCGDQGPDRVKRPLMSEGWNFQMPLILICNINLFNYLQQLASY